MAQNLIFKRKVLEDLMDNSLTLQPLPGYKLPI